MPHRSSRSYLRRLPPDTVKIDRSFVNRPGQSERDDAIVRGVLELAGTLRLTTGAAGIDALLTRQWSAVPAVIAA